MEEETDILSQQEMPPAVFALLDSTTELIKDFSQPFHSFFCKDDNPKYKNHINVITADKLAVIHLPSSSFIHTSLVFSLCGLFFCLYSEIHFKVSCSSLHMSPNKFFCQAMALDTWNAGRAVYSTRHFTLLWPHSSAAQHVTKLILVWCIEPNILPSGPWTFN